MSSCTARSPSKAAAPTNSTTTNSSANSIWGYRAARASADHAMQERTGLTTGFFVEAHHRYTLYRVLGSSPLRPVMVTAKPCVTTAGELVRKFSHYSEIAQDAPVVITKNGLPRNVLISIEEFDRLRTRDQQAFL